MKRERQLDRREFTAEAALAALAGVVITVSGCGGGYWSPSSPSMPSPSAPSPSGGFLRQVGHHLGQPRARRHGHRGPAGRGERGPIDIRGSADHTHRVTLTIDALKAIQAGQPVVTDSTSTSGHDHTVTFNSDSPETPSHY